MPSDIAEAGASIPKVPILLDYVTRLHTEAIALLNQKKVFGAVAIFRQLTTLCPSWPEIWNAYGVALSQLDDLTAAIDCYLRALKLDPNCARAHLNLGNAYYYLGNIGQAVVHYRQAERFDPQMAEVHSNLGCVLKKLGMEVEAEACFAHSLALDQNQSAAHFNLATLRESHEDFAAARLHYGECLRLQPTRSLRELRSMTMCPTVFADNDAIDEYRAKLLNNLQTFADRLTTVSVAELNKDGCAPPFNLPYQGREDRHLKESFASIYQGKIPEANPRVRSRRCGLGRIGFVVTRRHEHAMLRCLGGVLDHMPDDVGELLVFCDESAAGALRIGLNKARVQLVPVSRGLAALSQAIHTAELDVLYHWEVGTDKTDYLLPFLRLAPMQCTSWGIPETCGIAEMDYYLSSTCLEETRSSGDYTEKLFCLDTLLSFYRRRRLSGIPRKRSDFGLPAHRNIYLCAQYLGKLHPDFDEILANILRQDNFGTIAIVADAHTEITNKLRRRFVAVMPDVVDRIAFLPFQKDEDYLHLMATADVFLDPIYYGGMSTAYDAFSIGTPIVTQPTPFQRGRYATALYQKLNIDIGIAVNPGDYARRAVLLATNKDLQQSVRQAILDRSDAIFEDVNIVQAYASAFHRLVAEAREL